MTASLPEPDADRFDLLLDLYAPVCEDAETGAKYRDPSCGIITHEQLMVILHADAGEA